MIESSQILLETMEPKIEVKNIVKEKANDMPQLLF